MDKKRLIGLICGLMLAVAVPALAHAPGLTQQGAMTLGILGCAIVWWICDVLPEFATAILMATAFVVVAGIDAQTVFGTFAQSTWWLLVAAFALGVGMNECGLMRRMAVAVVSHFPSSFASQTAGFVAAATVLGPLIPSMSVKATMLTPLAMHVGEQMGYERVGKEMTGFFLAVMTGVNNAAPVFISASIIGYALLGLYPEDVQAQFDYLHWLLAALPWFVIVSALNLAALIALYGPHGKGTGGKSQSPVVHAPAKTPLSRDEKWMAAIMTVTVALWVTQSLHGVPAFAVALLAVVCMVATGVLSKDSFKAKINWTSLVFIGIVLGLGGVFSDAGLNEWVISQFSDAFTALAVNPYVFIVGIAIITIVLRLVIVSQIAFLNIFMAFVIPIATGLGINPWVIGMTSYAVISMWFAKYQNPVYLVSYYCTEEHMTTHAKAAKYCVLYTLICIAGLLASVPLWQMMGLI